MPKDRTNLIIVRVFVDSENPFVENSLLMFHSKSEDYHSDRPILTFPWRLKSRPFVEKLIWSKI